MTARDKLLLWVADHVLRKLVLGSPMTSLQDANAGRALLAEARA